jgi:hypothetical protein
MADIAAKQQKKRNMNPNSLANLKPRYAKGESGNPGGKPPKAVCITSWLKEYADRNSTIQIDSKNLTFAQAAALSLWRNAAKGEVNSYNVIADRIEGKAMQAIELSGKDGAPLIPEINILLNKVIQVFLQIPGISDEQKRLFADGINQQLKEVVPNLIEGEKV